MLRFHRAGRSHSGLVRAVNEDSGFAGPSLVLVADGVGGAAAGEVASATAAYVTCALAVRPTPAPTSVDRARRRGPAGARAAPGRYGAGPVPHRDGHHADRAAHRRRAGRARATSATPAPTCSATGS